MAQHTEYQPNLRQPEPRTQLTERITTGGSTAEGLAGAGALVLAILGLIGVLPQLLLTIAVIAIGAGLILEGMAVSARASDIMHRYANEQFDVSGGVTVEFLGGAAGVVLGILALLRIAPATLIPAAAIVFGATLLFSTLDRMNMNRAIARAAGGLEGSWDGALYAAASTSVGSRALIGLGSAVLGVLVLAGTASALELELAAMLAVGVALFLCGVVRTGQTVSMMRHSNH